MDIDTAANFLVGSILFGLGFIVFSIVILVINNIFHKYWKKFELFIMPHSTDSVHYVTEDELKKIEELRKAKDEAKDD